MNRRNFLLASAGSLTALDMLAGVDKNFVRQFEKHLNKLENQSISASAENEDFWGWVREIYTTIKAKAEAYPSADLVKFD